MHLVLPICCQISFAFLKWLSILASSKVWPVLFCLVSMLCWLDALAWWQFHYEVDWFVDWFDFRQNCSGRCCCSSSSSSWYYWLIACNYCVLVTFSSVLHLWACLCVCVCVVVDKWWKRLLLWGSHPRTSEWTVISCLNIKLQISLFKTRKIILL